MQAALYYGPRDIRIEDVEIPTLAAGEVLVKVLRSGICGTDAGEWVAGPKVFPVERRHPHSGHLGPIIPGHEFVGEIVESRAPSQFLPGTLVASGAGIWCEECRRCRQGRPNKCERYRTLGLNVHGGMAEYVAVPAATLRALPAGLGIDHAALAQPLAVGIHAARRAGAASGDRVVVIGAGAIGSFVLAGLRHLGDFHTTAVDISTSRLARAKRLGTDLAVMASTSLADDIAEALDGARPDVVIEASGAPGQLALALDLVTDGGRVEAVGIPKQKPEIDMHAMIFREITLETTLAHVCDTDLPAALRILADNPVLGKEFAEAPVGLAHLGAGLDRLANGQVEGKVLIDPAA
ncbi:alcohol dehydrogenase catalytic domain-containing protein [Nocardia sp. AG03]|uniref:zinc-dependent alcohol dehydrogenase n=1 Tax=Nocardia sp. AG03 TaxID=3025312 RepID=UPI0024189DFD|nr:alcohol dehydrogenase catalytic domain-containing protein [Nocardia sp. AG03]